MGAATIRKAKLEDGGSLAECFDSAYSIYKSVIPDLPDVSDGLTGAIADKSVWIAELEGKLVGGIVLNPMEKYLLLENVAVDPGASGAGIGKALIGRAEAVCLNLGLKHIRLSTHKNMEDNIGLYSHLGWHVVGIEGNKVHMTKRI